MASLGKLIAAKMKASGLNLTKAAKKVGVSLPSFRASLIGKSAPNARSIGKYATFLDLSEDAVIESLEANNAYRAGTIDPAGLGHEPADETDFDVVLDRAVLDSLLQRLRPRQRKILHLRFFEQMSQAQIAENIGTSQVHVGRLISSSLAELRAHLAADVVVDEVE